jgi:hypothetical protein
MASMINGKVRWMFKISFEDVTRIKSFQKKQKKTMEMTWTK